MRVLVKGRIVRVAKALVPATILALGLAGTAPRPAEAQFFDWGGGGGWGNGSGWGGMSPEQIYRAIGERGFRPTAPLRRNGAVFVADVIDRRGRRERLIVAVGNGQILERFLLTDQHMPRRAGLQPGDDLEQQMEQADRGDLSPPIPPAAIPGVPDQDRVYGNADDNGVLEPVRPRLAPRGPRPPKPRLVDRTPDTIQMEPDPAASQPTRLKAQPSEPLRLPSAPGAADRPAEPASRTASRPVESIARPSAPAPAPAPPVANAGSAPVNPVPSSRMRDPLAIPRNEPQAAPAPAPSASAATSRRVAPGTVSGASAAEASSKPLASGPVRSGDVPVAPLD